MRDVLVWIEGTALGHVMRESGPWTYAIVNVWHVLGISALLGSVLVVDLRLLGFWRHVPLAPLASATNRVTASGLLIALLTGSALLATKATAYDHNPFLYIKFPAIALGLINVLILNLTPAWREVGLGGVHMVDAPGVYAGLDVTILTADFGVR